MFNKGELAIFRRVGLTPVFFGETIVGADHAEPDLPARLPRRGRPQGRLDSVSATTPEWKKLKAIPEYADKEIVSRITNKILTPTAYSEI